jgi:hypothetical protein
MARLEKLEPKKVYEPPVLTVYGTVRELTQAVGRVHHPDGSRVGFNTRTGKF